MGASPSVDCFGSSEASAKEAERVNEVAYQQRAVNYARSHLFSESPMKVVPTREGGLTMTVDPTRANEMLDPRRGRLGAPHLVTLTPTGDLTIQLFDDAPAEDGRWRSSFLDPISTTSPHFPPGSGGGNGRRRSSSNSTARRRRSSVRGSSGSMSPNSPTNDTHRCPTTSPISPTSRTTTIPATNSPTKLLAPMQPPSSLLVSLPASPKSPPRATCRRRVVRRWALAAPYYLPVAPPPPRLQDRSATHVTIAWDPPPNDGGLVERYEVEYRPSLADRLPPPLPPLPPAAITSRSAVGGAPSDERQRHEINQKARRDAEAALVARNPTSFGWRALRTLHWYEWSYVGNGEITTQPVRRSKAASPTNAPQVSNAQRTQTEETKSQSVPAATLHVTNMDERSALIAVSDGSTNNSSCTGTIPAIARDSAPAPDATSSRSTAIAPWGTATGMRADLRNLKPAAVYEFRVRAGSHFGWSPFSAPSEPIASEPTPPDAPRCAPFAIYSAGDALWLNWPAAQPNGARVLAYELQWLCNDITGSPTAMRRASTPSSSGWMEEHMPWESIELSDNGYFLRWLTARSRYSARVRARNSVGWGPFSSIAALQTTSTAHDILRLGQAQPSSAAVSSFGDDGHNDNDALWSNSSSRGGGGGGDYSSSNNWCSTSPSSSWCWDSHAPTSPTAAAATATARDNSNSNSGGGAGASDWAVEYEREEWWREHFDWRRGIPFRSHCLTGERRNSSQYNSRSSNHLDNDTNEDLPDGVPGLSHLEVAELRFRFKRKVFQRALRRDIGVRAFSSSSLSSETSLSDYRVHHNNSNDTVAAAPSPDAAPSLEAVSIGRPSTTAGQRQEQEPDHSGKYLWLRASRASCCEAMLTRFASWDPQVLRKKRLKVQFEGEEGIDSGGLAKEFFVLCAEALVSSSSSSSSSWSPSNTAAGGVAGSSVKRPTTVPNSSGTAYFQVDRRSSNRSSSGTAGDASYTVCVARHDGGASTARGHSRGCARRESGGAIRGGKGRGKGKGSSSGSTSNAAAVAAPPPSASASSAPPSGAWRAVGRFLGKALVDRQLVPPLRFNHALLKRFLGRPVELADLAGIDDSLLASLTWVLHNSIEGILFETFTAPASSSSVSSSSGNVGQSENDKKEDDMELVELCPGGRHIEVTDANKAEYVDLRAKYALGSRNNSSTEQEEEALAAGLAEVVPASLLAAFNASELERLFVGQLSVDVNELRAFAHFQGGLDPDNAVCLWLWEYWRALPLPKRGQLLAFVTGSSRVPLDGFDPPLTLCLETATATDDSGSYQSSHRGSEHRHTHEHNRRRNHESQRSPNSHDGIGTSPPTAIPVAVLNAAAVGRVWLPRAHTCFNQLVLPRAPTYDALAEGFEMALNEGGGFYLA